MNKQVALYARVSSEKQVQANTIDSQIFEIKKRIECDGYAIKEEYKFVDDGHSGSTLMRPALEHLRDLVSNNEIDIIYIHSPDRLARRYAYQYLLIEEFSKFGAEIIFLNNQMGHSPESDLLLQMQGIISEYERTKIMERSRRGKLHAARQGEVGVLAAAPYGYKYMSKQFTGGSAIYEVVEQEAEVVRQLFKWVGIERLSLNEVTRRLANLEKPTRKGNTKWDRGTILHILKNPAYKGSAAFGKTKIISRLPHLKQHRNRTLNSKRTSSTQSTPKNEWILIPVPSLIDANLFETVQDQLEENRKRKRERKGEVKFLLSGLIICQCCQYSYSGNGTLSSKKKYGYYICVGGKNYCYRVRVCDNKPVRSDLLEKIVWDEVKVLLNNPCNLEKEYQRRLNELTKIPDELERNKLNSEMKKIQDSVSRLIDSYADGFIDKMEFEPRVNRMKLRLSQVEHKIKNIINEEQLQIELEEIIAYMKEFFIKVECNLDNANWETKRNIIKALIKRVEIASESVNVVFRVTPDMKVDSNKNFLGDCCRSNCFGKPC